MRMIQIFLGFLIGCFVWSLCNGYAICADLAPLKMTDKQKCDLHVDMLMKGVVRGSVIYLNHVMADSVTFQGKIRGRDGAIAELNQTIRGVSLTLKGIAIVRDNLINSDSSHNMTGLYRFHAEVQYVVRFASIYPDRHYPIYNTDNIEMIVGLSKVNELWKVVSLKLDMQ